MMLKRVSKLMKRPGTGTITAHTEHRKSRYAREIRGKLCYYLTICHLHPFYVGNQVNIKKNLASVFYDSTGQVMDTIKILLTGSR